MEAPVQNPQSGFILEEKTIRVHVSLTHYIVFHLLIAAL